jgi:hypothetical protein
VLECEEQVKKKSSIEAKAAAAATPDDSILTGSVKTLNIPFESEPLQPDAKCFACGKAAQCYALWGRSY